MGLVLKVTNIYRCHHTEGEITRKYRRKTSFWHDLHNEWHNNRLTT